MRFALIVSLYNTDTPFLFHLYLLRKYFLIGEKKYPYTQRSELMVIEQG
jgi:hypothetical protein